jgi:hypothetical protein
LWLTAVLLSALPVRTRLGPSWRSAGALAIISQTSSEGAISDPLFKVVPADANRLDASPDPLLRFAFLAGLEALV